MCCLYNLPVKHQNGKSIHLLFMSFNSINGSVLCCQCSGLINKTEDACQAMGMLFHNNCFSCCYCFRQLKGKIFYKDHGKLFCEEDYLYCGFQQSADRCKICGHMITNKADGNYYHVDCFRCIICNECLDGAPFTLDKDGKILCIKDYYLSHSSNCEACNQPIIPEKNSLSTKKVVVLDKEFHFGCFQCEECQMNLTIESDSSCYPKYDSVGNLHLYCRRCLAKSPHISKSLTSSSSSSSLASTNAKKFQSSAKVTSTFR